jgi:hypothetical protein
MVRVFASAPRSMEKRRASTFPSLDAKTNGVPDPDFEY